MRTSRGFGSVVLILLMSWLLVPGAWAFQIPTHQDLNDRSAAASTVGARLTDELDMRGGLEQKIRGKRIVDWIRDGGAAEDQYFGDERLGAINRSKHHFHNPLLGWDVAGLDGRCAVPFSGQASVRWAQATDQEAQAFESATWADARRKFKDFLTLGSGGDRDEAGAQMFRILGQQMHLIADLAVPAHVRNEIHCTRSAEGFEVWAATGFALAMIRGLQNQDVVKPDPAIFAIPLPAGELVATVPIARLWDSDQYDKTNPDVTRRPTIGLAEYTNANFFSGNTIFAPGFPYPARTSADLLDAPEPEPKKGELRRYLTKVRDGATVNHLAVPSALYEFLPAALKDKKLALDDKVFADYASLLFPRAVGYSAALLDHFFRGRLDVDLVDDGGGLRLAGTNASTDPLDGGMLTVHADGADGLRGPASAAVAVGRVEPGDALPAVTVTPPAGAERFVAVYTGALGLERPADTFTGAVIGKVLGGYRVEEVFSDGTRWNLRTPKGIFPLPILRSDIVDLRWGDADNTLVGRTTFGRTGQLNKLRAYRLNRPPGSADVPLRAAPGGGQEVDAQQTAEATFPFGLDVGGLQLNSTINYQQYLISFVRTQVFTNTVLVSDTYSDGKVDLAVNASASARFDWRLTLDLAKFNVFSARPYSWQLQQIGLTADGRMVALVAISLTQLDASLPESFAVFPSKRFVWCDQKPCSAPPDVKDGPPARVGYAFGLGAVNHWALVDVSQGRILRSTMADGVVIDNVLQVPRFREVQSGAFPDIVATQILHRIEDGTSSYPVDFQNNRRFGGRCSPPAGSGMYEAGRVDLGFGFPTASVSQYRGELAATEFPPYAEHLSSGYKYCVGDSVNGGAMVSVASDEARVYLNDALGAFRVPDGSERVVLLFDLGQGLAPSLNGSHTRVVAWDPFLESASLRQELPTRAQLVTAARGIAVVSPGGSPALTVVPLDGDQPPTAFPMPLGSIFGFRALSPAFLYNVLDLRFYRYRPALARTALPAPLAAGGSTTGDYHAIRLP